MTPPRQDPRDHAGSSDGDDGNDASGSPVEPQGLPNEFAQTCLTLLESLGRLKYALLDLQEALLDAGHPERQRLEQQATDIIERLRR
jgi:hypothetical protein